MRTLPRLALLCLSATTLAQPTPASGDPITLKQFQDEHAARMMAADTDHDGRVSRAEWAARAEDHRPASLGGMGGRGTPRADAGDRRFDPNMMFDRLDRNHDGFIDPGEIAAQAAERFMRMDRNGDGMLTPNEMTRRGDHGAPALSPPGPPGQ